MQFSLYEYMQLEYHLNSRKITFNMIYSVRNIFQIKRIIVFV